MRKMHFYMEAVAMKEHLECKDLDLVFYFVSS